VEIHSRPGEGTTVWLRIEAPRESSLEPATPQTDG
jgi:hypothetical protein